MSYIECFLRPAVQILEQFPHTQFKCQTRNKFVLMWIPRDGGYFKGRISRCVSRHSFAHSTKFCGIAQFGSSPSLDSILGGLLPLYLDSIGGGARYISVRLRSRPKSTHLILSYKSVCFSSHDRKGQILGSYLPVRETNNSYTNMRNYRLLTTEESEFSLSPFPFGEG